MTSTLLIALSLLLITAMLLAVRGHAAGIKNLSELEGRTHPVDLEAFQNLIDPGEEEYLRANLPPREFRAVQRERMRAALGYVTCVARNAAVLLRLGEATRDESQPEIAQLGRAVTEQAVRLRMLAALAAIKILARIVIPDLKISPATVMESYRRLAGQVTQLCRYQMPANVSRIVAAL